MYLVQKTTVTNAIRYATLMWKLKNIKYGNKSTKPICKMTN